MAHELMLTGRRVGADEAEHIGLVVETVDDERLLDRALEVTDQIASLAPWGTRLTQQGMWTALEHPSKQSAVEHEDRQPIMAIRSAAMGEVVLALLEKPPAHFQD